MRANSARTLLSQIIVLIEQRDDSTDTGCDNYAEALFINIGGSSIFPRLAGCNEGKLFRAIKATHLNAIHLICRLCMNTSGEVNRKQLAPILGEKSNSTFASNKCCPRRVNICA
jgi:hypothetical protein